MKKENIDNLIARLEREIKSTQKGLQQVTSLIRLKEIAQTYKGEDKIVSSEDLQKTIASKADELKILTGWENLDSILRGFRLQQLVVVSALTKSGKTSWLMDLTSRIKQFNPMWFPFEESAEELIRKYMERNVPPPLFFTPEVMLGNTTAWIEERIIESVAKYGTQVVVIDQLDFIVPFGSDNHALRVGQAMRELKGIAKRWNVCIFLICHLVKAKMDSEPTLEDLKGSSSIGQEADTVIMLWREMKKIDGHVVITNNTNVSVQANRRTGSTGNVKMVYVGGKFLEMEWESEKEQESKITREFEKF